MRAIILAAGKGERLKGVVDRLPKPMIKIDGKPILQHNIEWLKSFGIRDIYVNLHHLPDVIRDYFGYGRRWGVKITYSYEHQLLGTAGAVRKIADDCWFKELSSKNRNDNTGQSTSPMSFLVLYGDNLLSDFNLNRITDFHRTKRGIGTVCLYHKDEISQSGIAVMNDENRIIEFVEKPSNDKTISNLVNTGIYVFETGILEYIPKNQFTDFGRDIFPGVIKAGENLYGVVLGGNLIAIDTPALLERVVKD